MGIFKEFGAIGVTVLDRSDVQPGLGFAFEWGRVGVWVHLSSRLQILSEALWLFPSILGHPPGLADKYSEHLRATLTHPEGQDAGLKVLLWPPA